MSKRKGAVLRKRPPVSASGILKRTLSAYRLDPKIERYSAFPHWLEIVGEDIAKVAVPIKINQRGIMVVRVLDAVWAQELSLRKTEILDKLCDFGAGAPVEDIKFVTGNPKSLSEH